MTSGGFFHRFAAPAGGTDPFDIDVLGEQLAPPAGHRTGIETEQLGDTSITAAPGLEGFEARIQAPLLLVEQTEEQHDGCAQLIGQDRRLRHGPDEPGFRESCPARQQLLTPAI